MEAGRRGGGGKHSVVHACTTGMDVGKCAWSHRPLRMEERSRLTNSLAYLGEIYTRVGLRPTPRFKLSPCLRFGVLRVCVEMPPSPDLQNPHNLQQRLGMQCNLMIARSHD